MTDVRFLGKPPCPCGHPECRAFGEPLRSTGHSRGCWSGCVQCSRPKRTQARRRIPESVRRQVLVRAGGYCEARIEGVCVGTPDHLHHVRRRSQGGPDTVANLKCLCDRCHEWTHQHPHNAVEMGLLAPTTVEPNTSAVLNVERVE